MEWTNAEQNGFRMAWGEPYRKKGESEEYFHYRKHVSRGGWIVTGHEPPYPTPL